MAFIAFLVITRDLGLRGYGQYVVLLALLAAATVAWNATVLQAVAADMGHGSGQQVWDRFLVRCAATGTLAMLPVAWMLFGPAAAGAVAAAAISEALRVRAVPLLILNGQQRRMALATGSGNAVRLGLVVALAATDWLSPATAILSQVASYITTSLLQGFPSKTGERPLRRLTAEVAVEAFRWIENYGPVLGIAAFLGIATAGGFDLVLKFVIVIIEMSTAVGLVVLPRLLGSQHQSKDVMAQAIRVPTLLAAISAIVFGLAAVPVIQQLTATQLRVGHSAAVLASVILVGPWEGLSKAALLAAHRSGWLLSTQVALSTTALASAALTSLGPTWVAFAIALGHFTAAAITAVGLSQAGRLPSAQSLLSPSAIRIDLRNTWSSILSSK